MRWFRRSGGAKPTSREAEREAAEYLASWLAARRGVEVYVEPKTSVTGTTMLLVAHDGEFTRRSVRSPEDAKDFAREYGLPIYDATVVGYPQRMRDFSRRHTLQKRRDARS